MSTTQVFSDEFIHQCCCCNTNILLCLTTSVACAGTGGIGAARTFVSSYCTCPPVHERMVVGILCFFACVFVLDCYFRFSVWSRGQCHGVVALLGLHLLRADAQSTRQSSRKTWLSPGSQWYRPRTPSRLFDDERQRVLLEILQTFMCGGQLSYVTPTGTSRRTRHEFMIMRESTTSP